MYTRIAVPVDLAHSDKLDKAVATAADLAKHYDAALFMVAVTASAPSEVAHNPEEFSEKLEQFAASCSAAHDVVFRTRTAISTDPAVDLDRVLDTEFHKMGADLVVMASHLPGLREYIFSSNAGFLASHTDLSIFVVRQLSYCRPALRRIGIGDPASGQLLAERALADESAVARAVAWARSAMEVRAEKTSLSR